VDYVNLGTTGLRVSRICLGMMSFGDGSERTWTLSEQDAEPIVKRAVEAGVIFFDTADVYNAGTSETITGRLVGKFLTREEAVVATKVHGQTMPGENGRGARPQAHPRLDRCVARAARPRLRRPLPDPSLDPLTPIEETMEALNDVVRSGKARYIGASSMFAWQFAKAQAVAERHGWPPFVSMQNHYNLIYREEEREMVPQCIDQASA